MPGKKKYRDEASRVRIESRRVDMVKLILRGKSQTEVATILDISQAHICRELQAVVREWREEYMGDVDQRRAVEYQRCLHLLSLCLEEFEFSKTRRIFPKDGEGNVDFTATPTEVRVQANPEWMDHIRGLMETICKIRGVYQDNTTNNTVNLFNMADLARELKAAQQMPALTRLEEVEALQEEMLGKDSQEPKCIGLNGMNGMNGAGDS